MFKLRPSFITFLWLLAATLSSGTITLNIPDHIFVEQIAVVHVIRGLEDPDLNFSLRTVPPSDMQAGTPTRTISGVGSLTITVLFHESPSDQILLDLFDMDNPDSIYATSQPFNVSNNDNSTGPEGTSGLVSETTSSTQATDASASSSTSRSNPTSSAKGSRHFPASLIIGAIVGSLALLGVLVGILYWSRRRSCRSEHRSTDTFSSTMELKSIPNEKLLPNSPITSPSYLQRQDLPVVANIPPAVPVTSQSDRNTAIYHSDNRTIEEMAAKMQRMESEIVRLNHQMLPPAYPSPSNTQFG